MSLTPKLKAAFRKTFEPKYKRKLSDGEVQEIADNLTNFFEVLIKIDQRNKSKTCNIIKPITKCLKRHLVSSQIAKKPDNLNIIKTRVSVNPAKNIL